MASLPENGMIHLPSSYSVSDTLKRLEAVLATKSLTVFARIVHSGEAEKVGLKMRPTKLIVFGNPKSGTPLMVAAPTCAIELPLKALVSEDAEGAVWLSYSAPEYLQRRHAIPEESMKDVAGVGAVLAKAVE